LCRIKLDKFTKSQKSEFDGVVKSLHLLWAFGHTFDILPVCLHAWPNTMSCIWRFLLSHRFYFLRIHQNLNYKIKLMEYCMWCF